ncbi:MAG TPA: hypothetical protein VHG93_02855 [Longimicrobium sp.]|nr:hypothetical protein [Longimicrobium sp.]
MKTMKSLAALLGMMMLAGCGRELVGGGARDVDARATGDGTPGGSAAMAPSYALSPGAGPVFQTNGISGSITFDARVSLVRNQTVTPLGASMGTTVSANGRDTVAVASARVDDVDFPIARVVFTRVTANVTGGLVIGGVSLTGEVNVGIPAGDSVVVEMPVNLGGADEDATLLIDLDASAWLFAASPVTRVVSATTFRNAVRLRRADN